MNSEIANKVFKDHLNKFKPLEEVKKLYTAVLLEGYREHTGVIAGEKKKSLEQIAVYEKKLSVARNLLVTEKIDAEDYNLMKIEYNAVISKLEKDIGNVEDDRVSIEHLTTTGLENLLKLGEAFDGGTLADSREIIGLIFPENFTFSENKIQHDTLMNVLKSNWKTVGSHIDQMLFDNPHSKVFIVGEYFYDWCSHLTHCFVF